jgi:hypothetical protein
MQVLTRVGCLACLAVITLAYPSGAVAQVESAPAAAVSPPTDSGGQSQSSLLQEKQRERISIGLRAGFNQATFRGEDSTSDLAQYSRKTGIPWGVVAGISLGRWIAIQPELLWVPKGREVEIGGMLTDEFELRYIEFPVLARFQLPVWERVTPYLLVGPTFGFLSRFEIRSKSDGSVTDRKDMNETFDLGGLVGLGAQVHVAPRHAFVIEARYDQGLFSFSRDDATDVKNSVAAVMAGYQYSFSSSSKPEEPPVVLGPDNPNPDGGHGSDDEPPNPPPGPPKGTDVDRDGDLVIGDADRCPDKGLVELHGCPDRDSDGDGTLDSEDACPDRPGRPDGPLMLRGCPDDEGDFVADDVDVCPSIKGEIERDGCKLVKVSQGKIDLGDKAKFVTKPNQRNGSSSVHKKGKLQKEYLFLDEVAEVLRARPGIGKLRITAYARVKQGEQGQTVVVDVEKASADLCAKEMMNYLVTVKGVSSDRVEAVGDVEDRTEQQRRLRLDLTFINDGAKQD